jgi:hydroxyacylglutathione hydrolase
VEEKRGKTKLVTMKVLPVLCLEDNYAYLVFDEETGDAAAIDPVWPDQVLQAAQLNGAKIKMVLTTHHHWDHAGGNNAMKKLLKDVPIYGGLKDKVEGCSHPVQHGDEVSISPTVRVKCLETPCHTRGHISYFITSTRAEDKPAVFTGDTLFIGGCGRFF